MADAPTVVIHDMGQARAALAAAAEASQEIHLLTPPGGAHYAGAPYYAELFRQAGAAVPAARFRATLDCGDDAALALTAIAAGWRSLVLTRGGKAFAKVEDVAGRAGARVTRRTPAAVDLRESPDPRARCDELLRRR